MTRPAALSGLLSTAAAGVLLAGCVAFDLGPDTEAARAANAATPGYPRLVDVPPEPEDIHCLRAAIAPLATPASLQAGASPASLQAGATPASLLAGATSTSLLAGAALASPQAGAAARGLAAQQGAAAPDRTALVTFAPPVPSPRRLPPTPYLDARGNPIPAEREPRFGDLLTAMRTLSRLGQSGGAEDRDEFLMYEAPAPCPPPPATESIGLIAARAHVDRVAREMRAAPPQAPETRIVLPEDMGAPARAGEGPEAAR